MNYLYEEAIKLGADGVIFHDLFCSKDDVLSGKVNIYSTLTLEQLKITHHILSLVGLILNLLMVKE